MKNKLLYIVFCIICSGFCFTACTDDFENTNKEPNKLYHVEFNYVFPGVVYRSMNNLGELNYSFLMTYSRYAVVQAFCGARQEEGDGFYNRFYVQILKDLEDAINAYTDKEGFENRLAVVKTWKAYTYYIMASMYGGVSMSDALLTDESKTEYRYDTEAQVYTQILMLLDEALALYNPSSKYTTDIVSPDPVFGATGGIAKWRKFANSMRLNIALHIHNLLPETAETYAKKAMENEDWLIASNDENVIPHWGTNVNSDVSYYYNRILKDVEAGATTFKDRQTLYPAMGEYFAAYLFSFDDPRKEEYFETTNAYAPPAAKPYLFADTITRPHICAKTGTDKCPNYTEHQADGLNPLRRDSLLANITVPYVPMSELPYMAFNWQAEFIEIGGTATYQDPLLSFPSEYNPSFVKKKFIDKAAPLPILSYPEVCFMKAEAKIRYGAGKNSAEQYYNEGITASFAQYGIAAKASAYMNRDGVKWNTSKTGFSDRRGLYTAAINGNGGDENHLEQIYKQRYFAGYFNFLEAWNLERRTRSLRFPPFLANTTSSVEGSNSTYNYSMERFIYPRTEMSQNATQYKKALENLQAVSPFYRTERWGDNIFTSLGFAELNPDLATADDKYVGNKRIVFRAAYFEHIYGATYEELLAKAKAITGETNDTKALTKAFNYKAGNVLGTYLSVP